MARLLRIRRSAYRNWNGQLGPLYWSYDIRNDKAWRKRRWFFRWRWPSKTSTAAEDFLHELRRELHKIKEDRR
jgi:hypothetical protein